jgi:hypothetical protein
MPTKTKAVGRLRPLRIGGKATPASLMGGSRERSREERVFRVNWATQLSQEVDWGGAK